MIVQVLILCVLVLLVVAVIGLFAMMGELNSRLPLSTAGDAAETKWRAERARTGPLVDWPDELDEVVRDGGVVVALSTNCGTCHKVLSETPNHLADGAPVAVVVVAADEASGRLFANSYPVLANLQVHVDPEGAWLREAVGLDSSPAFFTVREGQVLEVFNFNSSSALVGLTPAPTRESRKP